MARKKTRHNIFDIIWIVHIVIFTISYFISMGNPASPKPTPEHRAEAERLVDFVIALQRSVIFGLADTLNKGNVSFPQFFLLAYLASEEYLTMTDIAKKMGHSTAAATGLVDRMEKLNLVERVHMTEDRRKIMVRITSQWVEFVAKMRLEISSELAILLKDMESGKSTAIWNTKNALLALKSKT